MSSTLSASAAMAYQGVGQGHRNGGLFHIPEAYSDEPVFSGPLVRVAQLETDICP